MQQCSTWCPWDRDLRAAQTELIDIMKATIKKLLFLGLWSEIFEGL
jgi:hypothetical protein